MLMFPFPYSYAGPDSVTVVDAFSQGLQHYMTTNRSAVYALVEGRGSGNKGSKMLFEIYRALGTVEIQDIIDITKWVIKLYSLKKKIISSHVILFFFDYQQGKYFDVTLFLNRKFQY